MNFEHDRKSIETDYCNVFQAKYLKGEWGIIAGFRTTPYYSTLLRKKLSDRQEVLDCGNEMCDKISTIQPTCPVGYVYVPATNVSSAYCSWGGCLPGQMPSGTNANGSVHCVSITTPGYVQPTPGPADMTITGYGTLCLDAGILNPPLSGGMVVCKTPPKVKSTCNPMLPPAPPIQSPSFKIITVPVTGTTLTDIFFSTNIISQITTQGQSYIVGVDFTQSGNTITGITITFSQDQVLKASI